MRYGQFSMRTTERLTFNVDRSNSRSFRFAVSGRWARLLLGLCNVDVVVSVAIGIGVVAV